MNNFYSGNSVFQGNPAPASRTVGQAPGQRAPIGKSIYAGDQAVSPEQAQALLMQQQVQAQQAQQVQMMMAQGYVPTAQGWVHMSQVQAMQQAQAMQAQAMQTGGYPQAPYPPLQAPYQQAPAPYQPPAPPPPMSIQPPTVGIPIPGMASPMPQNLPVFPNGQAGAQAPTTQGQVPPGMRRRVQVNVGAAQAPNAPQAVAAPPMPYPPPAPQAPQAAYPYPPAPQPMPVASMPPTMPPTMPAASTMPMQTAGTMDPMMAQHIANAQAYQQQMANAQVYQQQAAQAQAQAQMQAQAYQQQAAQAQAAQAQAAAQAPAPTTQGSAAQQALDQARQVAQQYRDGGTVVSGADGRPEAIALPTMTTEQQQLLNATQNAPIGGREVPVHARAVIGTDTGTANGTVQPLYGQWRGHAANANANVGAAPQAVKTAYGVSQVVQPKA